MTTEEIRWCSTHLPHSLTYRLFIRHFTELNDIYWAHVPSANTIEVSAKRIYENNPNYPHGLFLVPDEEDRRLAPTYKKWKSDFSDYRNFTRLNIFFSLVSCFETYLRNICCMALESKPGIILGNKNAIDGLHMLKTVEGYSNHNNDYKFNRQITSIVKGCWQSRIYSYELLFDYPPTTLYENLKRLDIIRMSRNEIAHSFFRARDGVEESVYLTPLPSLRLSHNVLLKHMKLMYDVASAIDAHLYPDYIGTYELYCYYQKWIKKNNIECGWTDKRASTFGNHLGKLIGAGFGKVFMTTFIECWDNA